ncbi:hypothetical protein SUGI_1131570 [Cryptomeria japonica]|nr:hypothetical protein SUGI_1131570 [Cryptomeria japonica]
MISLSAPSIKNIVNDCQHFITSGFFSLTSGSSRVVGVEMLCRFHEKLQGEFPGTFLGKLLWKFKWGWDLQGS